MIASPIPLKIVEFDAIKTLIDNGFIVAGVGGGGIPVIENEKGELQGVFAVIDKDRASSLLAAELKADLLLISTAVEKVALNFNKPDQKNLDRMTLAEAKQYYKEGHFLSGSMDRRSRRSSRSWKPIRRPGAHHRSTANIVDALNGKTGTWIVPD